MQRLQRLIARLWNWLQASPAILLQAIVIAYIAEGLMHLGVSAYAVSQGAPLMIVAMAPVVWFTSWVVAVIAFVAIKTWKYFRGIPRP